MQLLMCMHHTSLNSLENRHNCLQNNVMNMVECNEKKTYEEVFGHVPQI